MLREQAEVERVEHRAHAGHGVVKLEVPGVVIGEGGHTVAGLDAEALQRPGKAIDSGDHLAVGDAMEPLVALGHDLFSMVQSLQPPEHVLKSELVVLHQALHGLYLQLSFVKRGF
jgi:hypothetical protein